MPTIEIEQHDEASPEQKDWLDERLYEFNVAATGLSDGRELALFVRDGTALRAGLTGVTWGGCCEIRQLWVHESLRGTGVGRRLMERAEALARERGCQQILVATHSFQAPGFYEKLGFVELSRAPEYPRGHAEILLRKALGPRAETAYA